MTETVLHAGEAVVPAAAPAPTLAESAAGFANAQAALDALKAKRAKLAQELADCDADIASANASSNTHLAALRKG